MANFLECAQKIIDIVKESEIYNPRVTDEKLWKELEYWNTMKDFQSEDPLCVLHYITREESFSLGYYDDCNSYLNPGYYEDVLKNLSEHSKNSIAISDIVENWGDDGMLGLEFVINSRSVKLRFDPGAEHDTVPSIFTDFIEQEIEAQMKNEASEYSYLRFYSGGIYSTFLLPSELVEQFVALRAEYDFPE